MRTELKTAEKIQAIAKEICGKEFPEMTEVQKLCFTSGFLQGYRLLANDMMQVLTEDKG